MEVLVVVVVVVVVVVETSGIGDDIYI